jgi:hypothetical protein
VKLRKGHRYRVYDPGRFTLALDHGYGSSSGPRIGLIWRSERHGVKSVYIPVQLRWSTAYKLRKFGALHMYRIQGKVVNKLFTV